MLRTVGCSLLRRLVVSPSNIVLRPQQQPLLLLQKNSPLLIYSASRFFASEKENPRSIDLFSIGGLQGGEPIEAALQKANAEVHQRLSLLKPIIEEPDQPFSLSTAFALKKALSFGDEKIDELLSDPIFLIKARFDEIVYSPLNDNGEFDVNIWKQKQKAFATAIQKAEEKLNRNAAETQKKESKILPIWNEAKKKPGYRPHPDIYVSVITAFCVAGERWGALDILKEIEAEKIPITPEIFKQVLLFISPSALDPQDKEFLEGLLERENLSSLKNEVVQLRQQYQNKYKKLA